ncbi:cell division protein FtsK [Actinospica sp. MGRD01-02]|uniref:Cell division protein FtsK n=1 Tax=Actinospica acidithermotolerans TaxID=2828514 RepID=A0A941EAC0_9ACTN|nr:FtsK/SpoIIIE domain-containing protein [Actinospica acidithermotolerans]MBR7827881.1 cell division protein FtsK [Actinospica acidithermotolerans]
MRIPLTAVDAFRAQLRHLVADVDPGTPVAELAARLAGFEEPAPAAVPDVYVGSRRLDSSMPLRETGISAGAVLGLDSPVGCPADPVLMSPPNEGALLEIRVVGGPDSGRIWPLGMGVHDIGPATGSTVEISGDGVPERGVQVTVGATGLAWLTVPDEADGIAPPTRNPAVGDRPAPDTTNLDALGALVGLKWTSDSPPGSVPLAPGYDGVRLAVIQPPEGQAVTRCATGEVPWPVGGDLVVGDNVLRLCRPEEADAAITVSEDGLGRDVNRPPRIVPPLHVGKFTMPKPPTVPARRAFPLTMMLAPALMGVGMVFFLHSYYFLMFSALSPLFFIANMVSGRRSAQRAFWTDLKTFWERRLATSAAVRHAVAHERTVRCETSMDPACAARTAIGPGRRLWERRRNDGDYLLLRVGTVDQASMIEIDDQNPEDGGRRKVHWNLPEVPIAVDLGRRGVLGVTGDSATVRGLARWLVTQTAVLHSPRDVQVYLLTDGVSEQAWDWVRWLPHLRPGEDGPGPAALIGNEPDSVANRISELISLIHARQRARSSTMSSVVFNEPDIVVVVDGARRFRDVAGVIQILTDGPRLRIFAICLDEQEQLLPEECTAVVRCTSKGLVISQRDQPVVEDIRPDLVSPAWCERVARALAPLRDVTTDDDAALPTMVPLLELLDQDPPSSERIIAEWERRPASTAVAFGVGYDGPVAFDLVRDGPHALVAGTTGSGKSELLQSMLASAALVNRPDELVFVLVDYKGGSAFQDCVRLPHVLGMVTDLDSHLVERALASLNAELRRREQVLNQAEAKDHAAYRALRSRDPNLPALPRLMLIIDEFATMIRALPDFISGLVSIAQRGRSLGIHLVLATQRPGGAVTADIRANTSLRIALRVTDPLESQDVIDTSDAVGISATVPGRAIARLAHKKILPFQTAYSGAVRRSDGAAQEEVPIPPMWLTEVPWSRLGRRLEVPESFAEAAEQDAPTDLTVLVDTIIEAAGRIGYAEQPSPWLPPLPDRLLLDQVPDMVRAPRISLAGLAPEEGARGGSGAGAEPASEAGGAMADPARIAAAAEVIRRMPRAAAAAGSALPPLVYGLSDIPALQARLPLMIDPATFGHLYVLGGARSGRTQVLRTIAAAAAQTYSVADMHIYGVDAAGGALAVLQDLPHCGTVAARSDLDRVDRVVTRIASELTRRQELLTAGTCANLTELRAKLHAPDRPPHILLLVDGWESLAGLIAEYDGGRLTEEFLRLVREGAASGVHLIVTSERSLLGGRMGALNDNRLLLRMGDKADFTLIGLKPSEIPDSIPPGRGWLSEGLVEAQIAVLDADTAGQRQADGLRRIASRAASRDADVPAGRRPFEVATLPAMVPFSEAYAKVPARLRRPMWALLGLGGDDLEATGVDLSAAATFVVAGPAGSGRSNALTGMAVSLLAGGTRLIVITPRVSPLSKLAEHPGTQVIDGVSAVTGAALDQALAAAGSPCAVLVDDCDLLALTPADAVFKQIVATGRDRGISLVCAGSGEMFTQTPAGWIGEFRKRREGMLLAPRSVMEGDLIGVRLPVSLIRGPKPRKGLAFLPNHATGGLVPVQVPLIELE